MVTYMVGLEQCDHGPKRGWHHFEQGDVDLILDCPCWTVLAAGDERQTQGCSGWSVLPGGDERQIHGSNMLETDDNNQTQGFSGWSVLPGGEEGGKSTHQSAA
jgi:hypothetical protein